MLYGRPHIRKRNVLNERFTGFGMIKPGANAGKEPSDYTRELFADIAGAMGGKHTPEVEESFKRRGRRAFNKGKTY